MNKGLLGKYTYIAMTKVDIWEHRNMDIKATAVHEYIHSYLVRTTLYGNFMMSLEQANSLDKTYEDIIETLYENEESLQEAVATLIEIIYIWYKDGEIVAKKNLKNLPKLYQKYIRNYQHIFDKEYIINIYRQYLDFVNVNIDKYKDDKEFYEEQKWYCESIRDETEEKTALNLLIFLILKSAKLALTIDMSKIDKSYWNTKKKIKRYICNQFSKEYYPNVRFKMCMKCIFPRLKGEKSKFNLSKDISIPQNLHKGISKEVDQYILCRYEEAKSKDGGRIKNKIKEYIYKQGPLINTIKNLELESILYASPQILNIETAKEMFNGDFLITTGDIKQSLVEKILSKIEVLHIHPSTGKDEKYEYIIALSTIINNNVIDNHLRIHNNIQVKCTLESNEQLFKLIDKYENDLYFTGCQRTEHILEELEIRKSPNNIFINSAASLSTSIDFINRFFENANAEIINMKYGDVLYMKKNNMIFIQCVLPESYDIIRKAVEAGQIRLKNLRKVELSKSKILNQNEWEKMELILEAYFKGGATYIAGKI